MVINVPGMDSYKEISTALYGDRFLNRGFATLNIDGPGQYESPMLGIYFTMQNWVETGKAVCDWLAKRPEVDMSKVVCSGTSFGTLFGTLLTAHEPRVSACAVISVCHEPGCHTIFEEASPTFKKRFMYMSGITDEAQFDKMRQGMTWEGHADRIKCPYLCVAGEFDELSPVEHSFRLVEAVKGAQAHRGLSGIAALGRQRAGGEPGPVPADPGRRLARRPRRRQAVPERALVRAQQRPDRQEAVVGKSFRGAAASAFTRVYDALWRRARNPEPLAHVALDSGSRFARPE